jgi:murein hydrolase activator
MKFIGIILGALIFSPLAAAEDTNDTGQRLGEVERQIKESKKKSQKLRGEAKSLEKDMGRLRSNLVSAARTIQNHETKAAWLEDKLAELKAREEEKQANLTQRRDQFAVVVMALERMARYPPEAMIFQPASPNETVRGAILLRTVVPEIELRARKLRRDLSELDRARRDMAQRKQELAAALSSLSEQRLHLDSLLARKATLKKHALSESNEAEQRAKTLAREAKSLRDLLNKLNAARKKREKKKRPLGKEEKTPARKSGEKRSIADSRGNLPFPVVGDLVGLYGQVSEMGLTRKGITIETAPSAQVIAPYGGLVAFSGHFRGYGQLLIIEHSEGYHSLLAGMSRIDSVIGRQIVAGEPVGIMGQEKGVKPTLYVELRRSGRPVNPLPWLVARKSRINK